LGPDLRAAEPQGPAPPPPNVGRVHGDRSILR
jgi:hypothetical protein